MAEIRQRRPAAATACTAPSSRLAKPAKLRRWITIADLNTPLNDTISALTPTLAALTFTITILVRTHAALSLPVPDCDEVFNYWEPTHYLMHGYGMQTWEYAPQYGLRSYLYILLHALTIAVANTIGLSQSLVPQSTTLVKVGEFYALRVVFALVSSLCETAFVVAISHQYRRSVAVLTFLLLVTSAGLYHSTVSYLPSTFAMHCFMLVYSMWMLERYMLAILFTGVAVLIGWPFSAVIALPLALTIVWRYRYRLYKPIIAGTLTALLCLVPSVLIDYHYYRQWLVAVWNITVYNSYHSTDSEIGANLYGVEPVSYYVANLLLNFNAVVILALLTPAIAGFLAVITRQSIHRQALVYVSGCYLWLAVMASMPHKEERFLFVVYPLLCFAAAYTACHAVVIIRNWLCCVTDRRQQKYDSDDDGDSVNGSVNMSVTDRRSASLAKPLGVGSALTLALLVTITAAVSLSRIAALITYYHAPYDVYIHLSALSATPNGSQSDSDSDSVNVCVGKEWYRFPSHFFLGPTMRLRYLESDFTGLLPRLYREESVITDGAVSVASIITDRVIGTSVIPPYQNEYNRQERERFVDVATCDYIVDFDLEDQHEPHYYTFTKSGAATGSHCVDEVSWRVVAEEKFLVSGQSPSWSRAFYVPGLSAQRNVFRPYQLLARQVKRLCHGDRPQQ